MLSARAFVLPAALLPGTAAAADGAAPAWLLLWQWTPAIASGFLMNVLISVAAMLLASLLGLAVGLGQLSGLAPWRRACHFLTHFFRNAPWLVVLFYCMLLLPFQLRLFGVALPFPDWAKAILGIAIGAAANVSEIVRGAVQSIPPGQWESAESLGFSRRQTVWLIVLPQCLRRMLPSWMNLYALVVVSTPLCNIVGVHEVMSVAGELLANQDRHDLLLPVYGYLLLWFFAYCYPIARLTRLLERRPAPSLP
ncbi:amino acid ABC transporter permease [Pseudothauera rhizosphaerae]|uniref:Amino acid ABC transporter permease n=1 Tax=Pseudothauera rhizosphaerae TaxID=2565932 RepID=A0A4V3WB71_9RHOO|nr:amino acid ABC transporter permease [Pseudothauera rhizosphaerae]THF62126.1 amino acid ABC transporter permease [Pseudothauera rhizosphaerae]